MTRTFEEFRGAYRAPRFPVTITTRGDLLGVIADLQGQLANTPVSDAMNDERSALRRQLEDVVAEAEASLMTFEFEGMSTAEYQRTLLAHPPTAEQAEAGEQVNRDTFEVAVVARCAVEPDLGADDALWLRETLTQQQWDKLVQAALGINMLGDDVPKVVRSSRQAEADET